MKISTREVVLLTVLFLMLLAGAYYLFYYTPYTNEISELQEEINDKTTVLEMNSTMLLRMQALTLEKDALKKEFAGVAKYMREDFDDADILRLIEKIIKPYSSTMNIEFANSTTETKETAGATSVHTVNVSLTTSYNDLQGIIKAFEEGDVANRITNFACSSNSGGSSGTYNKDMSVMISIDFLER